MFKIVTTVPAGYDRGYCEPIGRKSYGSGEPSFEMLAMLVELASEYVELSEQWCSQYSRCSAASPSSTAIKKSFLYYIDGVELR